MNETSKRATQILEITALELLVASDDGIELNEGYEYNVNGSLPQLADGLAKLFLELDNDTDIGEQAGEVLLTLVAEYYKLLKNNKVVN